MDNNSYTIHLSIVKYIHCFKDFYFTAALNKKYDNQGVTRIRLKIKDISEEKGIKNPYVLASKTGLGYAICYRLWHENQQRIDLKTILLLCDSLEVMPGDLFDYKKQ